MKKMKKFVSAILALLVVTTSISPTSFVKAADATNTETVITVGSTTAAPGSSVDVDVALTGNPGILGATLELSYDSELTLESAVAGDALSALTMTKPGTFQSPCKFNWDGQDLSDSDVKDGTMLTLRFKVAEDVEMGKVLNVGVAYGTGAIVDRDLQPIKVQTVNGSVSVMSYTPGDLNDDGLVNATDVILLRRYIAGGYKISIVEALVDINDDGSTNATDVIFLRRFIAGGYGITVLPIPHTLVSCEHSMTKTERTEATCTADGNIPYWTCSLCNKIFSDEAGTSLITEADTIIKAKGHTVVIDPKVEPTTTTTGLTQGSHCSVCNEVLQKQENIPVLEANPDPDDEQYEITYYLDNNNSYLQSINITNENPTTYKTKDGLKLKNLKVDGYVFEGWYDGAGANGTLMKTIPAGTAEEIELYARWTPVNYTITFDSPLVECESKTYTVETGATLTNPEWFGYTFAGWSDEAGNVIKRLKPGTTGNKTLYANWASKRNQTVPVKKLEDPIIEKDEEKGIYLFAYELGRIENVPLYTIKDFGNVGGITIEETYTTSGKVTSTTAQELSNMISEATTKTNSWTLSESWNESATVSEEHLNESGIDLSRDQITAINEGIKLTGSDSEGGSNVSINENGTSSKIDVKGHIGNTTEVGASATIPVYGVPLKVDAKNTLEMGVEAGYQKDKYETESVTDKSYWNTNSAYDYSRNESSQQSVSEKLSQKISDKKGYSQTQGHNQTNSSTSAVAVSDEQRRTYTSSLSYATEETETTVKKYSTAGSIPGYYRVVAAGIIHVFGVVGYDAAAKQYFTYTYNVWDDTVKDFIDYSKVTSGFDDYENGILPFEIPSYVEDYVDSRILETEGLEVNTETGKIFGYTGTSSDVFVPEYMSVDNGTENEAIKITGFETTAFKGNENITSVHFSGKVEEIPDSAFEGCTSLTEVRCKSVKKIGKDAFKGCVELSDYTVSNTVESLGANAFEDALKIKVDAANIGVFDAAIASGAKQLNISLGSLDGTLENKVIALPSNTEYFEINGANKTYKDIKIKSDAKTTKIIGMNFENKSGVPLKLSSENVTLNKCTVNTDGKGLILSADHTNLALYGSVNINSIQKDAMLCKDVTLSWANTSAVGKLYVKGNILVCGTIDGNPEKNLSVSDGEIIRIDELSFEQLLQDSLEWILASEAPTGAHIVAEKWKYKETSTITSSKSSVDGYTLYDTKSAWGAYGAWSGWSTSPAYASDSRQVETNNHPAQYATQYNYSRWTSNSNNSGNLGPVCGTWGGAYCGNYFERGWGGQLAVSGTQYSNQVGGYFNLYGGNQWFNEWTRQVVTSNAWTEYRYRDRALVYTYYLKKVEDKESATEVTASDKISDVQKWVQCVY